MNIVENDYKKYIVELSIIKEEKYQMIKEKLRKQNNYFNIKELKKYF